MTLLVRDVEILGANRKLPGRADIFISGERISAIGKFPNKHADIVIDGQGAYLSPGFIDVDTDSDHYLSLFEHPSQEDFLRQGVTTIIGGMCGASLAPLIYGGLESIGKWTDPNRVNINWHTVGEFLRELDRHPLAVNFGTLAGHETVRRAITGDAERDLAKNELGVLLRTMKAALNDGAFGFSTGLAYIHAKNTRYSELKSIADIARSMDAAHAAHLRNSEEGIAESVKETIHLAKDTGVKTVISHFVPIAGFEKEYEAGLAAIDSLDKEQMFRFDIYPSANTLRPIYTFLPKWAQTGGTSVMLANIRDEWYAKRIKRDMPQIDEDNFVVAEAPDADFLVGKSLSEIKKMYEFEDGRDALIRLMSAMRMRGAALYKEVDTGLSKRAIENPRSFIASNAASFSDYREGRRLKSERSTKTFTDFLRMVENEKIMPIETAIAKLTSEPAGFYGIQERGVIAEGNYADVICFKGSEIKFTIVNGRLAMQDGEFKNVKPGKALRRSASKT